MPPLRARRPPPGGQRRPPGRPGHPGPPPPARQAGGTRPAPRGRPASLARGAGRSAAALAAAGQESRRKAIALGLVGLLVSSLGAIAFVLYAFIAGGGAPPESAPSRPLAIPAGALQFGSLLDFERSLPRAGVPFALTISEPELNQRIDGALAKQPDLPFHDVSVRLLDGRAEFSGDVRAAGLDLTPTVALRFYAEGGAVRYDITAINLGPVPVPAVARQAISDTVARQLDQLKLTDKYAIDDLQIRPGAVTIVGRLK